MAAPNRAEIEATVLDLRPAEDVPGKHLLELEIRASRALQGGNFARPGTRANAFTFEPVAGLAPQMVIRANVEYIGDARAGWFQLHSVAIILP